MADISNIVTIQLLPQAALIATDNVNVVMVITDQVGILNSANRFKAYATSQEVAVDFGSESDVYHHALTFFAQTPNSTNVGGTFLVGYWRAIDEDVAASRAILTGAQLSEAAVVGQLQLVSDGSFDITVDATPVQNITGLDFRSATTLKEIALIINAQLVGAVAVVENNAVVVASDTTGVTSLLTYFTDPGDSSTYIGNTLGLSSGVGAVLVQGADASILPAETKLAALIELKAQANMFGAMFIDKPTSGEVLDLGAWALANKTLLYDVFFDPSNLDVDETNIVWQVKIESLNNYRCLYRKDNDRRMATAEMGRMHTVNFNLENSAITIQYKTLATITPEAFTQDEINKAQQVGLDIYTSVKNVGLVFSSGANAYLDQVYNRIAYFNALQVDMSNVLVGTVTKIPQTVRGVNALVSQANATTSRYVLAGVFAPGTWLSNDRFGDIDTFDRHIESDGYYFLAGKLSDQPIADRLARKSPPIDGAGLEAGAIHNLNMRIIDQA